MVYEDADHPKYPARLIKKLDAHILPEEALMASFEHTRGHISASQKTQRQVFLRLGLKMTYGIR